MRYGTMKTIDGRVVRLKRKNPGPKPLPPEVKRRPVNITLCPHWHDAGKQLAAMRGVSLSKYIESLIYHDSMRIESG